MRFAARLVAVAVLVAGGAACSGDDTTTEAELCAAFQDFYDALAAVDADDVAAYIKALKNEAQQVSDVGAPEDMPDDARAGMELTLNSFAGLDDDATLAELGSIEESYSEEELAQVQAFEEYLGEACPDLGVS